MIPQLMGGQFQLAAGGNKFSTGGNKLPSASQPPTIGGMSAPMRGQSGIGGPTTQYGGGQNRSNQIHGTGNFQGVPSYMPKQNFGEISNHDQQIIVPYTGTGGGNQVQRTQYTGHVSRYQNYLSFTPGCQLYL
uniref:Uncharacterized protein n=1 Tax=Meloidogyne hapla TaxID=6305 RepID=A0A1I8BHI4_MELHA